MSDYLLRQGDTGWTISDTLKDSTGTAVDLTGASVAFKMVPIHGGAAKINAAGVIDQTSPTVNRGKVHYTSATAADSDTAGDYLASWVVTYGGGQVQTFPNGGYILFTVTPTAPTTAASYLGLEEFKKTLSLTGQNYADQDAQLALEAASRGLEAAYETTWTLGASNETRYYAGRGRLVLLGDAISLTTVTVDLSGFGAYDITLAATDYHLRPANHGLAANGGNGMPYEELVLARSATQTYGFPPGLEAVKITGQFGWETVPSAVKQAVGIVAQRLLRRAREAPFGAVALGSEGVVMRAGQVAADPDIAFLLQSVTSKPTVFC